MGFFSKRPAAATSTGHAGDDQLLAELARRGDLASPRQWVHHLYLANEEDARGAAAEVLGRGWDLQQVAVSAAGGPEWVVIAEKHDAVTTPGAVREARLFFEGVAAAYPGGDYDGWEASL
jgi:acyl transferase domain-containing protein